MIINEDFFDDKEIDSPEEIEDLVPENEDNEPLFRFDHAVSVTVRKEGPEVTPEIFNRYFKRDYRIMFQSGIFSEVKVEDIYVRFTYNGVDRIEEFTGVSFDEFKRNLSDYFANVPLRIDEKDLMSDEYIIIDYHIVFTANVNFASGRDIYNFLAHFVSAERKKWGGFTKIYPLSPEAVSNVDICGLNFLYNSPGLRRATEYTEGMYTQIYIDGDKIDGDSIKTMRLMFMDKNMERSFDKICKRNKDHGKKQNKRGLL